VAYDGEVAVRFGRPISTAGVAREDIPELMERVRRSMISLSGRPAQEVDGRDQRQDVLPPGHERLRSGRARPAPTRDAAAA
jgi:hypothetical protein